MRQCCLLLLLLSWFLIKQNVYSQSNIFPASGNVGIGTTNPSGILELKSSIPNVLINGINTSGFRGVIYQSNGTSFAWQRADASSGEFRQEIGPSSGWGGYFTIYTDASERMRINKDGNIGIGTNSPFTKLMLVNMVDGVNTEELDFTVKQAAEIILIMEE
jgi:hypothetical protein